MRSILAGLETFAAADNAARQARAATRDGEAR